MICTAGISRSATIVISYLIRYQKMTYDTAFKTVKTARSYIKPNEGFLNFLAKYAKKYSCDLCKLEKKTEQFP